MTFLFRIPDNALCALSSAATWGAGDFAGGMGVKAAGKTLSHALRLVLAAHLLSFLSLATVIVLRHDPMPHGRLLAWGLLAGLSAGISLTAFYMALSRGSMGASAAISGLLAAAIPAAVSMLVEGVPSASRLAGFALAFAAICVIAAAPVDAATDAKPALGLAFLGGVGFGLTFVALRMANPLGAVMPMALARAGSLVTCSLLWLLLRLKDGAKSGSQRRLSKVAWLWAAGVAFFDTGGNLFFTAATRLGRLDVAAVLASLYPASTILLAAWMLRERPTRRQLAGMAVAVAAVLLISR